LPLWGMRGILNPRTTRHLARTKRDERLWNMLPAIDAPYDRYSLSEAETAALVEALTDGFGNIFLDRNTKRFPLPMTFVKSRLLNHVVYDDLPGRRVEFDEEFPLGFHPRRLEIYFRNQFYRFRAHAHEGEMNFFDKVCAERARQWMYEKPWYEFHALDYLMHIQAIKRHPHLTSALISLSGTLGRLVEQYYWRVRFEKAVVTGEGARKGASAGGKAKAELYQIKHSVWQNAASRIWAHEPDLTKHAVGEKIKNQLGAACTAKHIARCITRR
jgi:hypothetical protein